MAAIALEARRRDAAAVEEEEEEAGSRFDEGALVVVVWFVVVFGKVEVRGTTKADWVEGFVDIIVLFFTGITGKLDTVLGTDVGFMAEALLFEGPVENDAREAEEEEERSFVSTAGTVSVSFRCTRRRARALAAAVAPDDTSISTVEN
jgi:hypothetical protein